MNLASGHQNDESRGEEFNTGIAREEAVGDDIDPKREPARRIAGASLYGSLLYWRALIEVSCHYYVRNFCIPL